MRTELDKINPDSIPKFLREQDVSAAEAKTLATADVSKPKLDKDGTYDALKKDKDYQQKNMLYFLNKHKINLNNRDWTVSHAMLRDKKTKEIIR